MADFTCPLQTKEEIPETPPQQPCEDEMSLFGYNFKGVRTYSVVLIVLLIYFYTIATGKEAPGVQELAFLAVAYLFGSKLATVTRR